MEATWDLRANSSPRSLCVFAAAPDTASVATATSSNPFDTAAASSFTAADHAIALVYGTERGSLHYRCYAPPHSRSRGGLASSTNSNSIGTAATSLASTDVTATSSSTRSLKIKLPLGVSTGNSRPSSNLPRGYYPVDLSTGSLPGSVVACVPTSNSNHAHFLLLMDDNRGSNATHPGVFGAVTATLQHGTFHVHANTATATGLPRMSCATFSPTAGLVYAAGRTIASLPSQALPGSSAALDEKNRRFKGGGGASHSRRSVFFYTALPAPGVRSGQDGLAVTAGGRVAVVAVGNSFYAVAGHDADEDAPVSLADSCVKLLSFTQSSQVHPVIVLDVQDESLDTDWSCIFLASGRECAVVDLYYGPPSTPRISCTAPRNGSVTLASPILAAAASWPWLVVLTSDGLVSIRSPSCMAIPLRTVEVGTRPNDYFVLRTLKDGTQLAPWIMAVAYSGEGKVLQCQPDTAQDLADRLMRHAIDAFGANGFPRAELAEAVSASFTATSYVGPESSAHARSLLKQYLEAVLGLADFESGGASGWPTERSSSAAGGGGHHGTFDEASSSGFSGRGAPPTVLSSDSPAALLTGTALLCLVCGQLTPINSALASRAAKACVEKMGVVVEGSSDVSDAAIRVCELVAEKLLREASAAMSLSSSASPAPISRVKRTSQANVHTDFVEAAIYLLRSCGKHERAIEVAYEKLQHQGGSDGAATGRSVWSQIKYESYTATHLSELWATGKDTGCRLVLESLATHRLLENSPSLGLSVFTATHPQNTTKWRSMLARADPLAHPEYSSQVIKLLKSINPAIPYDKERTNAYDGQVLPLESGRALAAAFLESAIGIATGRPADEDEFDTLPPDDNFEERIANFHDELSFLLLEGVIAERRDDDKDDIDTDLGKIYRNKLRNLLRWPLAKIRPDNFLNALPSSFLPEKALVLGRVGRHEDALRILYVDLHSLDLALEYCDDRHEQQKARKEMARARHQQSYTDMIPTEEDNAYLPLVRVALESQDRERGTAAAIQVLALRRGSIDRAAALRLLPENVPVSAVARPFLIPALVDTESQCRRLTVVSALLRARYLRLKADLTVAQLKAQANLHVVPQLRSLNLGDPLHSTKAFRARPSATASTTMPDVMIVKYFFPRHLVIQAKVTVPVSGSMADATNSKPGSSSNSRALSDVSFVVAESSEEAIQPLLQVPIQFLPVRMTGSAWCVLTAAPSRMDGAVAQLTCELRYTVLAADAASMDPAASGVSTRTYVEELQDIEVHASHFS